MVSTRAPSSKSSRPFNNHLVTVPKAPVTIGIIVTFMFYTSFRILSILLWSSRTAKCTTLQVLSFSCWLLLGLVVWPSLGDLFVCQNPTGVCTNASGILKYKRILQDRFWVVHMPFVCMVKFNFLLKIPSWSPFSPSRVKSYTLSLLVSHIRLICDWSFRLYHCITYNCCLLCLIYSFFDMVGAYGVV